MGQCEELINGMKALFSPKHGVCYMFNNVPHNLTNTSLVADWPGPGQGVKLILDIEGKYFVK